MMDENQEMIRASAAAITGARGDLKRVRQARFKGAGFEREAWISICELGWLGLRLPEDRGGSGFGMSDYCAVAEELGAGLVPEPLIPAMAAVGLLPGETLGDVLAGRKIVLLAWQETVDCLAAGTETRFSDGRVDGAKLFVPAATGADTFAVTVDGGIALVDRDASGVDLDVEETVDGGVSATVRFEGAPAVFVPADDLDGCLDEAAVATSAYLLGVADAANEATLAYMSTRSQFGQLIGSFQALQHRAADMAVQIALLRASVRQAAALIDDDASLAVQRKAVSRAKARAGDVAMFITRQAVQLHGGIGFTDEHDIGLYLRKAMVLANAYGSPAFHRRRYAQDAFANEQQSLPA